MGLGSGLGVRVLRVPPPAVISSELVKLLPSSPGLQEFKREFFLIAEYVRPAPADFVALSGQRKQKATVQPCELQDL